MYYKNVLRMCQKYTEYRTVGKAYLSKQYYMGPGPMSQSHLDLCVSPSLSLSLCKKEIHLKEEYEVKRGLPV